MENALFELLPALRRSVAWVGLAELPTPVEEASYVLGADARAPLWLKRDDRSSQVYGGCKLRLLEHLLGQAQRQGASVVYASGATGSNFTLATALHAPRVGLQARALCFPQSMTEQGERNQRELSARARVIDVAHWSLLPLASEREKLLTAKRGERAAVLSQVRFEPESLLGYVSAGLELARQVSTGACPAPATIALPIGSAATSAGLLAGLALSRKLGLWAGPLPELAAVRIAAWPLSRRGRVLALAERALGCVAVLAGNASLRLAASELPPLRLVTDQLGAGYPEPTAAGALAQRLFADAGLDILDGTYMAKAAAHALERLRSGQRGPLLLWCTKSSAAL